MLTTVNQSLIRRFTPIHPPLKTTTAIVLYLVSATLSLAQSPTPKPGTSPEIILDRASADIFPESWLTTKISATAEPASPAVQEQCREIVNEALARYPAAVLSKNLKKVYVLGALRYSGVPTGGTNSRSAVYLVRNEKYSPKQFANNFHAEFSSILLRNYPRHFDKTAWLQNNPADFTYRGSGVQAIRDQQASLRLAPGLHEEGFLNEYGKASIEEDFNSYAARLFMGDPEIWNAIAKYPKVRAKADLAIVFYGKVDATLTPAFFQALRQSAAK